MGGNFIKIQRLWESLVTNELSPDPPDILKEYEAMIAKTLALAKQWEDTDDTSTLSQSANQQSTRRTHPMTSGSRDLPFISCDASMLNSQGSFSFVDVVAYQEVADDNIWSLVVHLQLVAD